MPTKLIEVDIKASSIHAAALRLYQWAQLNPLESEAAEMLAMWDAYERTGSLDYALDMCQIWQSAYSKSP